MKELQPNILNDYEHLISHGIELHAGEESFPDMAAYGITSQSLSDFLYEVQCAIDSQGSQKSQLTKYGIIAVIPIIVISAFPESMLPWGKYSLYAGIAIGLLLALLLKGLAMALVKHRIAKVRKTYAKEAEYADEVEKYINSKVK